MATGIVPEQLMALQISEAQLRSVPKPEFVNTVATYSMGTTTLNAELVTMMLPGFCFNPQRFAAIKMRLNRSMVLGFCGGIAVCPGSRDVDSARVSALRFTNLLLSVGFYVEFGAFCVHNIVMSVYTPFEINLPVIRARFSQCTEYKNSNFPGLSFRMGGDTKIVFNIFVKGCVVITGSRDPAHSHRAWWWLYTHVLLHSRMGSAPGTTSSARFRMSLHLRSNHLAESCQKLSTRHSRRDDGPLARSEYVDMLSTPSMRTPVHTPSTPRAAPAAAAAPARLTGGAFYLDRMTRHFVGHTLSCPYVRASECAPERQWFELLRESDRLVTAEEQCRELVAPHVVAGCAPATAARDAGVARRYVAQLVAAIGRGRCRLLIGADAPLRGHSIECPWLVDAAAAAGDDAQRDLECAIAEAETEGESETLERLTRAHADAGCATQESTRVDDLVDGARMFLMQLHLLAAHKSAVKRDADRVDVAAVAAAAAASSLDMLVDDVVEPETLYRLDALRRLAGARACVGASERFSFDEWPPVV